MTDRPSGLAIRRIKIREEILVRSVDLRHVHNAFLSHHSSKRARTRICITDLAGLNLPGGVCTYGSYYVPDHGYEASRLLDNMSVR
jgi:hypothetical protein